MRPRFTGLWRHPDFLKLWAGQTISVFGSEISGLAIPLTAALILGASPRQMGLLRAVEHVPWLLLGPLVGAWVDRMRRRPVLVAADLGRAVLLGSIPAAALLGVLNMQHLYVVGFLTGALTVFFQVAYRAYLPSLIGRAQLVEGNGKLEISRSAAQIAGPGLAGLLVQALGAPLAIAFDALSFLASTLSLGLLRRPEPRTLRPESRQSVRREIGEGLRLVARDPILRAITASAGLGNFFANVLGSVLVPYLVRELHLRPVVLGLIFGAIGPGALLGALLAARLPRWLGMGRAMVGAALLLHSGNLLNALAGKPAALAVPVLVTAHFLIGFGAVILNVNLVSLAQAVTPDRLLGRLNATTTFITAGAMPLGSLTGGFLGEAMGLRPTLLVGGIGAFAGLLWLSLSPIATLREPPEPSLEHP